MAPTIDLDYRTAFDLAPIGMILSRHRLVVDCNRRVLEMFRAQRDDLVGRSFEALYPSTVEYERTGARIVASLGPDGVYADDRVMKRADGELFWCHVSGRALDASDPHAAGIWSFEDLSARRVLKVDFTAREREIAALLIDGATVDVYRARLMRKVGASTTPELVHRLLSP